MERLGDVIELPGTLHSAGIHLENQKMFFLSFIFIQNYVYPKFISSFDIIAIIHIPIFSPPARETRNSTEAAPALPRSSLTDFLFELLSNKWFPFVHRMMYVILWWIEATDMKEWALVWHYYI